MKYPDPFSRAFYSAKCKCGHVRRAHGHPLPWKPRSTWFCKHVHCDCKKFRPRVPRNRKGKRG